jgi:hypothetical protein
MSGEAKTLHVDGGVLRSPSSRTLALHSSAAGYVHSRRAVYPWRGAVATELSVRDQFGWWRGFRVLVPWTLDVGVEGLKHPGGIRFEQPYVQIIVM